MLVIFNATIFSEAMDTAQRRRIFSGLKSLSVFGGGKASKSDAAGDRHTNSQSNFFVKTLSLIFCAYVKWTLPLV